MVSICRCEVCESSNVSISVQYTIPQFRKQCKDCGNIEDTTWDFMFCSLACFRTWQEKNDYKIPCNWCNNKFTKMLQANTNLNQIPIPRLHPEPIKDIGDACMLCHGKKFFDIVNDKPDLFPMQQQTVGVFTTTNTPDTPVKKHGCGCGG